MVPEIYEDAGAFAGAVAGWLEAREAENSLLLGVLARLMKAPPAETPLLGRVTSGGHTVLAAVDGGFSLLLSRGPDAAVDTLVGRLAALGREVPGVVGPALVAERFAATWARERRCDARLDIDQRIYEVSQPSPPQAVPGSMRPILPADLEQAAGWAHAFDAEALPPHERRTPEQARQKMASRIADGDLFGWMVEGALVSMAGLTRPTARTISVNAVYTPPAQRRHGYASALVAAISAEGLRRGKHACVLFTDLANPTSNAIYQRIGYRPVCDQRSYRFHPL